MGGLIHGQGSGKGIQFFGDSSDRASAIHL